MGQKVNPHGLRVGIIKPWDTQWYADKKSFGANLKEDNEIRTFIKKKYYDAAISKITVIRAANKVEVGIYTGRPGVLIGKAGSEIEVIKKDLSRLTKGKAIIINVRKVPQPGVKGVKITVGGRLDGREIAGSESYHDGSIPLQTIRADIDYGFAEAHTTFGVLGVKCWIYKGEVLTGSKKLVISDGGEE